MTRYVVIGAGAVGASLSAQLSQAGRSVVLVGRGEQAKQLRKHGLHYTRAAIAQTVLLDVVADASAVHLSPDDVIVVATKSQDVEAVAREWAWRSVSDADPLAVAADLPVIALQNGLEAERVLARRFSRVYSGSLLTPARYTSLGEVVIGSVPVGVITLGLFPAGLDERAEQFAADLRASDYVVQLTDDVQRWKAAKILHSVKNGLEVLTGDPEQIADLGALLTAEALAVLGAAGLEVADTIAERTEDLSEFRVAADSGIKPGQQSTWQSFSRASGGTEVDYLNGEIVLLGQLHGVPTPVNRAVQHLLGVAAANREAPGTRSADELLSLIAVTV